MYFHILFKKKARQYVYGKLTERNSWVSFKFQEKGYLKVLSPSKSFESRTQLEKPASLFFLPAMHMCFVHVQEMFSVAKIIFVWKRKIIQEFLVHLQVYTWTGKDESVLSNKRYL